MFVSKNVRLFRFRGQDLPDLEQVRHALRNLGFTVIDGEKHQYKATLAPNPILRFFMRNDRICLGVSNFVLGTVALSGGTLLSLGFVSGFDIPQLHEYRLGPMISVVFVISIILHLMFEAVIENVPQWSVRECETHSVQNIQRQVREIEQYSAMYVESMECWQRHMLCTMRRLHTGETLHFHAVV